MTTPKQVAANRRNARHSTGPRTPEGKQASRLNTLRHGLRARLAVQPGDDPRLFERLCADLHGVLQPENRPEELLVEKIAMAEWQLARVQRTIAALFASPDGIIEAAQFPLYDRAIQVQARLERASMRAYKEFRQVVKARPPREEDTPRQLIVTWVDSDGNEQETLRTTLANPNGQADTSGLDPARASGDPGRLCSNPGQEQPSARTAQQDFAGLPDRR